jgi:plastocyanin
MRAFILALIGSLIFVLACTELADVPTQTPYPISTPYPTYTPVLPTLTPTATQVPLRPTTTPTTALTQVPYTATSVPTPTLTAIAVPTPTLTAIAVPTPTLTAIAVPTPTLTATAVPTPTLTATATHSPVSNMATVIVESDVFLPSNTTIAVGGAVTWDFTEGKHTTTSTSSEQWNSGERRNGTFSHTFNTVGTFTYICARHPSMTGTVTVN